MGKAGMSGSFALSHVGFLSLLQCPEMIERKEEGEGEKKREASSLSNRGTR